VPSYNVTYNVLLWNSGTRSLVLPGDRLRLTCCDSYLWTVHMVNELVSERQHLCYPLNLAVICLVRSHDFTCPLILDSVNCVDDPSELGSITSDEVTGAHA